MILVRYPDIEYVFFYNFVIFFKLALSNRCANFVDSPLNIDIPFNSKDIHKALLIIPHRYIRRRIIFEVVNKLARCIFMALCEIIK